MDHLWAPWRLSYVTGEKRPGGECVFCAAGAEPDRDEETQVLHRGEGVFSILNRYPYNNGHLMVVPYEHVSDLTEVSPATAAEMIETARTWCAVLRRLMRCDGFNLGLNLGAAAGAGIRDHLHLHVVPRWAGDTNFMPVVGQTKVMPEALDETWRKLVAGWAAGVAMGDGQ